MCVWVAQRIQKFDIYNPVSNTWLKCCYIKLLKPDVLELDKHTINYEIVKSNK